MKRSAFLFLTYCTFAWSQSQPLPSTPETGAVRQSTSAPEFGEARRLLEQGKYDEAEVMNRRALAGYEKVLGKDHPSTLKSVYSLAYLIHRQKRYDSSAELYQRAYTGYRMILGRDHPNTLACENHYYLMRQEMDVEISLVEMN